jgi:flagellar hook protein FlgE
MAFHTLKWSGSSLKNIQFGIDSLSHNIANVNTTGYKKQQPNFAAVVNSHAGLGQGLSGTALNANTVVHSQGSLKSTGQFSDMAISGEGFFSVQNAAGEILHTRAGHFNVDANGDIVDPEGNYLLSVSGSRITLPATAQSVEIGVAGDVNILFDPIAGYEFFDQIQLATFVNPGGLEKMGGNNYRESVASGIANYSTAGQTGTQTSGTSIVSGALELANTNLSESLTDMMALQRSYQAVSRTSSTADEILQTTINLAS